MGHHRRKSVPFAELAQATPSVPKAERTDAQPWPQPISDGRWTDEHGTQWHLRGAGTGLPRPVLRRLLRRTELRVLHAYGLHPAEVSGAERQALLDRVERYYAGDAAPHSAFRLAEFRDDHRNVMLVIEEAC